ncbi:hypothetical protein CEXT_136891 [Caerostris extrusa]|uniref:Gamma-glutamylcyclotransferase n=1 Tax=Caerostris extrusa TaxID=172846 RepID=A0AAV4U7L6_CAEEX|nr:hypothetical protein CEXT_136891 [Caerostris extrusa]
MEIIMGDYKEERFRMYVYGTYLPKGNPSIEVITVALGGRCMKPSSDEFLFPDFRMPNEVFPEPIPTEMSTEQCHPDQKWPYA